MAKREGWQRGVGAYSNSGPKLRTPGEIPHDTADRAGSGPYSRSSIPMDHPSELETGGVARGQNSRTRVQDGAYQIDVDTGANPDGTGGAGRLPKR